MNFKTQISRLSYWGNLIHLLGSTKKVVKPYFEKTRSLKYLRSSAMQILMHDLLWNCLLADDWS